MSVDHIQRSVSGVIAYLRENPKDALSTSPPITAVMEGGLKCRATGDSGQSVVTDMPEAVGGGGSAPSPGWLSRAALATCDATRIALRAAELGKAMLSINAVKGFEIGSGFDSVNKKGSELNDSFANEIKLRTIKINVFTEKTYIDNFI